MLVGYSRKFKDFSATVRFEPLLHEQGISSKNNETRRVTPLRDSVAARIKRGRL
jgi:hypothetical protein